MKGQNTSTYNVQKVLINVLLVFDSFVKIYTKYYAICVVEYIFLFSIFWFLIKFINFMNPYIYTAESLYGKFYAYQLELLITLNGNGRNIFLFLLFLKLNKTNEYSQSYDISLPFSATWKMCDPSPRKAGCILSKNLSSVTHNDNF